MNKVKVNGMEIEFEDDVEISVEDGKVTIKSASAFKAAPYTFPPNLTGPFRQIEVWPQPYVGDCPYAYPNGGTALPTTGTITIIGDSTSGLTMGGYSGFITN